MRIMNKLLKLNNLNFNDNLNIWIILINERLVTRDGQTDGRDYEIT